MGLGVKNFLRGEDGAVTVDWVVLTAAIVGLGLAVLMPIATSTGNIADSTKGRMDSIQIGYVPTAVD